MNPTKEATNEPSSILLQMIITPLDLPLARFLQLCTITAVVSYAFQNVIVHRRAVRLEDFGNTFAIPVHVHEFLLLPVDDEHRCLDPLGRRDRRGVNGLSLGGESQASAEEA